MARLTITTGKHYYTSKGVKMKRFLEVIEYHSYQNKINCTYEMVIRMRFADRLKFLLFGAGCIFRFKDEYELQKKRKINLDAFRKWAEKQKMQESEG